MAFFRSLSIKHKLTLVTMVISVLVLLVASVSFMTYDTSKFRQAMIRDLTTLSEVIGSNVSAALVFQDKASAEEILSALAAKKNIVSAVLFKSDGSILAAYHRQGIESSPPSPGEDGYRFSDKDLTVYRKVVLDGKPVGTLYIQSDLDELSARRKTILSVIVLLAVLLGAGNLVTLVLVRVIISPLERMTDIAAKIAGGDFTQSVKVLSNDEVGVLANAFSQMSVSLQGIIKKIQVVSNQITVVSSGMMEKTKKVIEGAVHQAGAAETTASSITQMDSSVKDISDNIDSVLMSAQESASSLAEMSAAISQVAASANTLSSSVEDTSASLTEISASIKSVVGNTDALLNESRETTVSIGGMNASIQQVGDNAKMSALLTEDVSADAAQLESGAMESNIEGMKRIRETVNQSANVIQKLYESADRIGKIVTVINDVNRQTELLSLNAAILAAQAGVEGRGFSVVAEEIKSLAKRTGVSTKEIAQLIKDVQVESKDAVSAINEGIRSVDEGFQLSIAAKESLHKMLEKSKQSSASSRQIEKATLDQVKSTGHVTALIEKVHTMVQHISDSMKEVEKTITHIGEASEQMRTITQQVKISTAEQAKGSNQLSDAVENMTGRIQQIAGAMNNQKKSNEVVMRSTSDIKMITQQFMQMMQEMDQSVEGLMGHADLLKSEVDRFKV